MKARLLLTLILMALVSCGEKPAQKAPAATPYGSPEEVNAYLQVIDPLVMQLNTVHQELYKTVGTSGKATAANLAPAMEQGRPRLAQILAALDQATPPPLLVPFHQQIKKLVQLRLEAYAQALEGWKQEQQKNADFEKLYQRSEELLTQAQDLGLPLGDERHRIQQALEAAKPPEQAASR